MKEVQISCPVENSLKLKKTEGDFVSDVDDIMVFKVEVEESYDAGNGGDISIAVLNDLHASWEASWSFEEEHFILHLPFHNDL